DAAGALDLVVSKDRQSAPNSDRRHALRDDNGRRRMIEHAPDLAAREPGACGGDGLADGKAIGHLRISPIHAVERDEVASYVAHGDAHIYVGWLRVGDREIRD